MQNSSQTGRERERDPLGPNHGRVYGEKCKEAETQRDPRDQKYLPKGQHDE